MSILVAEEAPGTQEQQVPAEIVAVIAAAVAALLGSRVGIRSIDSLQSSPVRLSHWTQQGRVSVQASHNLKRKR